MPFLSSLQTQHERYVEVNGRPLGPPPVWNPTFIPDPLDQRRTLLKLVASALRGLAGRWRR